MLFTRGPPDKPWSAQQKTVRTPHVFPRFGNGCGGLANGFLIFKMEMQYSEANFFDSFRQDIDQ